MRVKVVRSLILAVILASCCIANQEIIENGLVNSKVERLIDISTHIVKYTSSIQLTNKGKSGVKSFLFAVDPSLKENLAFVSAWVKDHEDDKLTVSEASVGSHPDKKFWKIVLPRSLEPEGSTNVVVESVYTLALVAHPQHILQAEKQLVRFTGNLHYYSPYKTSTQSTKVTLASSNIESYTKTKPVSASDNTINYGPYKEKDAFSEAELFVHSENNTPFLTVSKLTRTIEVSHWGNIAVEEVLDIFHSGAKLKGSFSRYDYQRNQDGFASIKAFKTVLPSSARHVYYRDEIGNISTSAMKNLVDSVEVELRPRFPLFGGWKTHYTLGYSVPSYEYLHNADNRYALKMRFVDHIYDDMVIDDMTLRIILPEGCKNVRFQSPFSVNRKDDEVHYTYLDTVGRPVFVFTKNNLVEAHIQDFRIDYTFQKLLLLQEPLLVIGAFYLLFMIVIVYVRLDFSIAKDEALESHMRVSSLIEQVQSTHDKRSALYQTYDDNINKFKAGKDNASFQAQKKKIDADHKALTQQITNMQTKLKAENAEVAEKVAQVQKLDTQFKEIVSVTISCAEKLVAGKMNKNQYLDQESNNTKKKNDLQSKMEDLLASL